ncbi:hypothetical protein AcV7_005573 [Taiwanofungus camphoratus]|nr:hypothetical protein AcV7_005573 [Antrodia cinnamomea]
MSSQEEEFNESENTSQSLKKRKTQRACDACRRKKVRCDGSQMPNSRCSSCNIYKDDCTYFQATKKRGPSKGYVESLEARLENMEKLLDTLRSNTDFSKELNGQSIKNFKLEDKSATDKNNEAAYQSQPFADAPSSTVSMSGSGCAHDPINPENLDPSDDEGSIQSTLVQNLKHMRLDPGHLRFFGKSSSFTFLQTAIDLKREYSGTHYIGNVSRLNVHPNLRRKRPQYWNVHPWLQSAVQEDFPPHQSFPDDDLMTSLVDLYFVNVNYYMPILHRPTLEDGVRNGLHLRDEGFGSVVLLVCAIGSRFTDDPRVYLKGFESQTHSCGWQWFQQVEMSRKSLLAPPRLYDLQVYCLTPIFMLGTSAPQACWTIIGVGARLAQDVGAHRRKVYNARPTIEEELWKRAFWVLVVMDRTISHALGRPCAVQDEDFDLDLPIECDDEYWTHPNPDLAFKQPPGKPPTVTFFVCLIKLTRILAFALRTIYSINKSKILLGFVGPQWEQRIVAELDSSLNRWVDSVPDHLRWDPNQEDTLFLTQSAVLHSFYYQVQITVHRPFIPSPRKPSPLSFPSLAICTNAARSCVHVLHLQSQRTGTVMHHNLITLFTAGIVLLLNMWGGKRSGLTSNHSKEMADVHKCMDLLNALEAKWYTAGRFWDILFELASVGDLPLPQNPPLSHKRETDAVSPILAPVPTSFTASATSSMHRTPHDAMDSKGISSVMTAADPSTLEADPRLSPYPMHNPDSFMSNLTLMPSNLDPLVLPIHSEELGRLPLHSGTNAPNPAGSTMHDVWRNSPSGNRVIASLPSNSQVSLPTSSAPIGPEGTLPNTVDHSMSPFSPTHPPGVHDPIFTAMSSSLPAEPRLYQQQDISGIHSTPDSMETLASDACFTDNMLAMWSNAPSGFE